MARINLIEASIHAPTVVEVSSRAKYVSIDVRTELRNTSEQDVVLHAPSEDAQHFWHILDPNHREVLREQQTKKKAARRKSNVLPMRSLTIAGGHSDHEAVTLRVIAAKLKDGQTYTIRSENWAQIAETTFVAVVPKKKASSKKKRPVAKATAKKSKTKKTH